MYSLMKCITTILLSTGCMFSYKAEVDGYNLTTEVTFSNSDLSEISSHDSDNTKSVDLIRKQGATESTSSPKRNDLVNSFKLYSLILNGILDDNSTLKATSIQKPPKERRQETKKSIPIYYQSLLSLAERHRRNSSGIFDFPIFQTGAKDGYCQNDDDCQEFKRNSTCFAFLFGARCICPSDYVDVFTECLPLRQVGSPCTKPFDCPPFSLCDILNHTCVCTSGYFNKNGTCAKRTVGDPCKQTRECPQMSSCVNGTCRCNRGYVRINDECVLNINGQCSEDYDCERYLKRSICYRNFNRSECRCAKNYIAGFGECHLKVRLGSYCKQSIQCPQWSFCIDGICDCMNGFVRKGSECSRENYRPMPNFLLALIAGVIFLIVVSCLFVIIMSLRRKLSRIGRNAPRDEPPTISSMVDAGCLVTPDPSYERVDKPPSYDEAVSSSATLLTLNVQDVASEPPSYNQVQQQNQNGLSPSGP